MLAVARPFTLFFPSLCLFAFYSVHVLHPFEMVLKTFMMNLALGEHGGQQEGKEREAKGREGKGREGKGREGKGTRQPKE
jgi:hypothetical protein